MARNVILGLAAAMLVGSMLVSDYALAHYGRRIHYIEPVRVCVGAGRSAWNPFSRDAAQSGYPGGHYGCDCYRAANGRAMCRFY